MTSTKQASLLHCEVINEQHVGDDTSMELLFYYQMWILTTMTIFMHWTWQTTMTVMLTNEKEL